MVYRLSWLAGLAGVLFAVLRLERLLLSSVEGLPWEVVLLAAATLGAGLTWAALAYRLSALSVTAVNVAGLLMTVVRLAVPSTTWFIFPTPASFPALLSELAYGLDVARTGVAPVVPLAGIVALLAIVFWALGVLLATGLRTGRPYLAVLSPLVVYLQFATMDRRRSGLWTVGLVVLLGLGLLAVAADRRRRGTGLLTSRPAGAPLRRTRPGLATGVLAALVALTLAFTTVMARALPRAGLLAWRAPSALTGEFYGSVAYNPFVGIYQRLVNPTDTPLLIAGISGDLPPERVYFRLLSLESFNGTSWYSDNTLIGKPADIESFEDADLAFHGPTARVTQVVTILALQQEWLPAAYAPIAFWADNRAAASGLLVKVDDGALRFAGKTYRGMTYTVESTVPLPDLEVLIRDASGRTSPLFATAAASAPGSAPPPVYELPERSRYLDLPDDLDPRLRALTVDRVASLATDFEKAVALEAFFRRLGGFRYSLEVTPGEGATDLGAWLLDPGSPNYRTGYCEQFATAMGVMARLAGLPSRVVLGFTPGWQHTDGRVVVSDRNAHAWVEIWMPSQGWVAFDPTPRGDGVNPATSDGLSVDIAAALGDDVTPPAGDPGTPPTITVPDDEAPVATPTTVPGEARSPWGLPAVPLWLVPALAAALALLPAAKWLRRRLRLHALAGGDVSGAWREIVDRLSDLGEEPARAATPLEVAAALDESMLPLAHAYGESVYGAPGAGGGPERAATARQSLRATESCLARRHSRLQRLLSWYRLRSLAPRRWRRRRPGTARTRANPVVET